MNPPLTLLEEFVLLSLDDETGAHLLLPSFALGLGMGGAVLADLSIAGRISTGGAQVQVLNAEPTGNPLLDPWLALIAKDSQDHSIHYWLSILTNEKKEIESDALSYLIERGILKREDKKILWVLGLRRYPTIHNEERVEVRTRLERLILSDDIPSHFDATLISLLDGCQILSQIFKGEKYDAHAGRVDSIAASDLVGREVAEALRELLSNVLLAQTVTSNPF
ncbi:MAG: GPP34 family phosphoprotein [Verrucomicrobia bacterium]|nr:GPP34 family phosphoprotein [Verrucomicrobiota bacterium]